MAWKFNPFTGKLDQVDDTDVSAVWGSITGTLSDQTDLQAALDLKATIAYVDSELSDKQDTLVSGTNIKTVNGTSLLGSGDITVSASAAGADTQVQFNDGGTSLGGDAGLTYNKTTNTLTADTFVGALTGTASGNATKALDNLASVAINTTLVSDTDNTDALGTAAIGWSDLFLGNGAVITFSSAPSTADITITHSAETLTFAGGTIALGTATATGGLTGNVTGNVSGSSGTCTGLAGSATVLATPRAIYGNNFDGSAALDQIIASTYGGTGNGFTKFSGATTAEKTYTLPDASTDILTKNYTGALATGIVKNTTTTGELSIAVAGDFPTLNQNTTGSAATLTTTRTIWGQNFNGSANVTGDITLGASSITMTGSLAATGARVTKGWFTDIESTNMPTVGGTAILTSLTAPQFTTIELGHATDTTIARVGAGQISVEGVNIVTISSTDNLTNKTLNGVTIQNSYFNIDGTPGTDGTCTGNATNTFAAGYSSAVGDLVFFGSGGKWLEADSDAVATCKGLMGIALEAKTDTQAMLVALPGSFVRLDAWNWTVGATLYAGETLGAMQETIPTGADAIIKVVGFAVSADVIFFNPSPDQQSTVA